MGDGKNAHATNSMINNGYDRVPHFTTCYGVVLVMKETHWYASNNNNNNPVKRVCNDILVMRLKEC